MSNAIIVESTRFRLTLIREADVEAVFTTMNCRKTADIISFLQWPMTLEQAANWCKKSEKGIAEQNEFLFLAKDKTDSAPVGCISLHHGEEQTSEVGYWITENWQGCGCASELLQTVIDFAFKQRHLSKLVAAAALQNIVSLRVLQKNGFSIIGQKFLPTAKGTILTCHALELKNEIHFGVS